MRKLMIGLMALFAVSAFAEDSRYLRCVSNSEDVMKVYFNNTPPVFNITVAEDGSITEALYNSKRTEIGDSFFVKKKMVDSQSSLGIAEQSELFEYDKSEIKNARYGDKITLKYTYSFLSFYLGKHPLECSIY